MCIRHMLDSLWARPSVVSNPMKSSCCVTDCSCRRRGRFHSATCRTWYECDAWHELVAKHIYHSSELLFSTTVKLSTNANVVQTLFFLSNFFNRDGLYPFGFSDFCIISALLRSFPLKLICRSFQEIIRHWYMKCWLHSLWLLWICCTFAKTASCAINTQYVDVSVCFGLCSKFTTNRNSGV